MERGKKRSCVAAELPQCLADGNASPGALLVDSSGNAAVPSSSSTSSTSTSSTSHPETSTAVPQQSEQETAKKQGRAAVDQASEELQSEAIVVDQEGGSSRTAEAVEPAPRGPSQESDTSGVPMAYAKADKASEEKDKDESRKAFSSLVKATCSKRTHPY